MEGVELSKADRPGFLPAFVSKMENAGIHPVVVDTFAYYYAQILAGETGLISNRDIVPVSADDAQTASHVGEYAEAEPFYRQAIAMQRKLHDGEHPDLAANLHNLGPLLKIQGLHAEAEPLSREAVAMVKRLFRALGI